MTPTAIKLIVFDVDGVLTDGGIYVDDRGVEMKRFHVRDGMAIKLAALMGLKIGVITGRATPSVTLRMAELGVDLVLQRVHNKALGLETLCQRAGVEPQEVAFVGDDLIDLPAMVRCGYPIAVSDAVEEVRAEARFVTTAAGGQAAAREAVEHILKAQNRWDEVLERYQL